MTRAWHPIVESGLDVEEFVDALYEARAITKRQGNIEGTSTEGMDRKSGFRIRHIGSPEIVH